MKINFIATCTSVIRRTRHRKSQHHLPKSYVFDAHFYVQGDIWPEGVRWGRIGPDGSNEAIIITTDDEVFEEDRDYTLTLSCKPCAKDDAP